MMAVPPARVVRGVGGRFAHLRVAAVDGARTIGSYLAIAFRVAAVMACLGVVLAIFAVGTSRTPHRMPDSYLSNQRLMEDLRRWSAEQAQLEAQRAQLELQQMIEANRELMLATHPHQGIAGATYTSCSSCVLFDSPENGSWTPGLGAIQPQ